MRKDNTRWNGHTSYGYSSTQVSQLTGATARQLQWWDERNLLAPTEKKGHRRGYSVEDVRSVMLILELRKRGISIQQIRTLLGKVSRELSRRPDHGADTYVITDGRHVSCEPAAHVIQRILKFSKPVWLLSMGEIRQKLEQ
jgi:DNA-binding transcriptional MerR regulator